MADSLSLAMLVLLESLSPGQRAVLLLHDVFDYGYLEIAAIIGKSEDSVRQLASRARRHIEPAPAPLPNDGRAARRAGTAVLRGRRAGRSRRARGVARHWRGADRRRRRQGSGAGAVAARAQPCRAHADQTGSAGSPAPGVSLRLVEVNGGPGALLLDEQQRLLAVLALDIAGGRITSIGGIVNPDKLAHLGPVLFAGPPPPSPPPSPPSPFSPLFFLSSFFFFPYTQTILRRQRPCPGLRPPRLRGKRRPAAPGRRPPQPAPRTS